MDETTEARHMRVCETCKTYRRGIAEAEKKGNASLAVDGRVLLGRHLKTDHQAVAA